MNESLSWVQHWWTGKIQGELGKIAVDLVWISAHQGTYPCHSFGTDHSLVSQGNQINGDQQWINHWAGCGTDELARFRGIREKCCGFGLAICTPGDLSMPQFWYRCICWYPEIHKLMVTSQKSIIELGATLMNWWIGELQVKSPKIVIGCPHTRVPIRGPVLVQVHFLVSQNAQINGDQLKINHWAGCGTGEMARLRGI